MNIFLSSLIVLLLSSPLLRADEKKPRLVTIGGTNSEIVCALDLCSAIVASDSSSRYPAELGSLPQVGYARAISVEGVLAQSPDLIILSDEAGPKTAIQQLRAHAKRLLELSSQPDLTSAKNRILAISQALGREARGRALLAALESELELLERQKKSLAAKPKVLFVYARGSKSLMIAGENTAASFMIELAGGENAAKGFKDFKTLTPEAVMAAAPEVVLVVEGGLRSLGGPEAVWALPGLKHTPAFRAQRLVVMDDLLLLGMGPRLGVAARELLEKMRSPAAPLSATVRN